MLEGRLWHLNNAQLVLRGPKCAKKISPTPLHHHHQPEPLRQGRMDPCFHVLYAKFWPYHLNVAAEIKTHQTRQRFSNLLLSNSDEPVRIVASVSCWQERHPVWSSAAVAHLLQGSTCCAFRDGILHTLILTSGYLSYCCLSIISNQSAHYPLTSTKHFRPQNCVDNIPQYSVIQHHWIFSLFRTILCKP